MLLILFFSAVKASAQENKLSISGQIYEKNGESLPFASVRLFDLLNNKTIATFITGQNGDFNITAAAGSYGLQVSMVGYKSLKTDLSLSADVKLGKIQLEPDAKLLGEVKVTSKKPLITRKIDRYVLNVAESVLSSGRGTFELLNYAPGVMTIGNAVSINGNTATKIMVNGRLLRLSGEQVQNYLANLRSEDVETIEVIPNPGAEFEAEGGGGLINVVLKKQRAGGLNGSLGLGAMTPENPSYNTSAQLNYGYKKLQLYGSHNFTKRTTTADLADIRRQGALSYNTDINTRTKSDANNFRIGAAYDLAKNHYLGIEFNGNINSSSATSLSNSIAANAANGDYVAIDGDFFTLRRNKTYTSSLNYDWKLDTLGSSMTFIADHTHNSRNSSGDFFSRYTGTEGQLLFDSLYRNTVPVKIDNYNAAANFLKVFKNAGELKFGVKYTRTRTENEVVYEYLNNGVYINDAQRSNAFRYTENIAAIYSQYNFGIGRTKVQLGLRGEYTDTEGLSMSTTQQNSRSYFNIFPSAFIKRQLDEKNTLSLNYGRRLDRPSFNSLNPFEWRSDDYTYISGNPNLKPQFTNSLNLSYIYMNRYSLTLFANFTDGVFAQYLIDNGAASIVANYTWANLSSQKYFGANFYIPVKVARWWEMVNNIMVYRNIIQFPSGENNRNIFSGKTTQNISITKSMRVELSGLYQSKYNSSNQVFVPNYYIDMGLSQNFFKNSLSVKALVTDIFNTNKSDYEARSGTLYLLERQKYLTRRVSLQLTYNFNIGKKVRVKKVEGGNGDAKDRM